LPRKVKMEIFPENLVDDPKKTHQKFWPWKRKFFRKKTSFRNLGPRKFFPYPQTRRQVSATGSTHWTTEGNKQEIRTCLFRSCSSRIHSSSFESFRTWGGGQKSMLMHCDTSIALSIPRARSPPSKAETCAMVEIYSWSTFQSSLFTEHRALHRDLERPLTQVSDITRHFHLKIPGRPKMARAT